MKLVALTFETEDETRQSVLGFFDDIEELEPLSDDMKKYQIRHDDDGEGIPTTIENKVAVNRYGDFITDTEIKFPLVDNASAGYALLKNDGYFNQSICELNDIEYENNVEAFDSLERFRNITLSNDLTDAIEENLMVGAGDVYNNIHQDTDGNIHLNYYGVPYTLEIHNDKDYE